MKKLVVFLSKCFYLLIGAAIVVFSIWLYYVLITKAGFSITVPLRFILFFVVVGIEGLIFLTIYKTTEIQVAKVCPKCGKRGELVKEFIATKGYHFKDRTFDCAKKTFKCNRCGITWGKTWKDPTMM